MLKYFISLSGMVSLLLLFGCQKEETVDRDYPRIRTAAVNEITDEGATFNATVLSGSMEAVSEYGFVWGTTDYLSVENSEKIIVTETPENSRFSCDITFALEAMKKYFVRAYVKAGEKVIYGDVVQFMSLGSQAPQIDDYYPKSGVWGDTITITGTNFSYQNLHMVVYVGDKIAPVVQSTIDRIKALVPSSLDKNYAEVYVEIYGNRSTAKELFHLNTPAYITTVTNTSATWGDTLVINGVFPYTEHAISFSVNNVTANIIQSGTSLMKIQIPNNIPFTDSMEVSITVDKHKLVAPRKVKFKNIQITTISPAVYGWLDTITIKGAFHPSSSQNKVSIGGIEAVVLSSNASEIRCIIPAAINGHVATLTVTINGTKLNSEQPLNLAGPILYSCSPSKSRSNATVYINGKYFKNENTKILVNGVELYCGFVNSKRLYFQTPEVTANGSASVKVKVYNKEVSRSDILTIENPYIIDFSPKTGTYGDIITVTGVGFDPGKMTLIFGGSIPEIIEESGTLIRFKVPNGIPSSVIIKIFFSDLQITASSAFTLVPPSINSISQLSGKAGDYITLYGNYLCPDPAFEYLYFKCNGVTTPAKIISGNTSQIVFEVPSLLRENYIISLEISDKEIVYNDPFLIINPWRKVNFSLLGAHNYGTYAFVHQSNGGPPNDLNDVYLLGGYGNFGTYQLLDFTNLEATILQGSPYVEQDIGGCAFSLKDRIIYFPANEQNNRVNTAFAFNTINHQWSQVPQTFPGLGRKLALSFSVNDTTGFILGGQTSDSDLKDFWIFHGKTNTWEQLEDFPGGQSFGAAAAVYGDDVYILDHNKLWKYNKSANAWIDRQNFPGPMRYMGIGFTLGEKIYFGTGSFPYYPYEAYGSFSIYNDLWEYTPGTDSWRLLTDLPGGNRLNAFGFEMDGKGYIGGGGIGSYSTTDIYEYDPNYE